MLLLRSKADAVRSGFREPSVLSTGSPMVTIAGDRIRLGFVGWSFIAAVLIPAFVIFVYNALIASREYVTEAHFTIRAGAENRSTISDVVSTMTSWAGIASSGSTTQDMFIASDYIRSSTIIEDIGGKARLAAFYSRPEIDWIGRLDPEGTLERMSRYWRKKVSAVIDTPSSVVTVRVRAYSPEDAVTLASAVLERSEALINDISDRIRRDALNRAENEVKLAQQRLEKARAELLVFRRQNNIIDPELSAKSMSETLAKLVRERIQLDYMRSSVSGSMSRDAPSQRVLASQIASLDAQIQQVQGQLTGKDQEATLANQISGFENLSLSVQFGERLYAISQASYEKARVEAERQQLYLVVINRPSLPERAYYPRILLDTGLVAIAAFILWGMIALIVAWVRDHAGG